MLMGRDAVCVVLSFEACMVHEQPSRLPSAMHGTAELSCHRLS